MNKIHNLIEHHCHKNPEKSALSFGGQVLSYKMLNLKANHFAQHLVKNGVQPGDFVPLFLEKSCDAVVAILGILKAGAAYVPIDIYTSDYVIKTILAHVKAPRLITQAKFIKQFKEVSIELLDIETCFDNITYVNDGSIIEAKGDSNIAYMIYTSGTTGAPKGVMVTHENLLNTYRSWKEAYDLDASDMHLQMANMGFDVFSGDLIRALCSGATLVLCSREILMEPEALYNLICKERINFAEFVPSVLRLLLNYLDKRQLDLSGFRVLICGSDQWTMAEYDKVKKFCTKQARVISSYGLTETTIDSTYFEEMEDQSILRPIDIVPLGRPFSHVKVYILDESLKPVAPGEIGEICISGGGVALGYFRQAEMTAERFVPDINDQTVNMYKTGDMGKCLPDGNIAFLGRNQLYLKINGRRLELPAIESIFREHEKVLECFVTADTCEANIIIKGYFKLRSPMSYDELLAHLQNFFDSLGVVFEFYEIQNVPTTPNGKVDRKRLQDYVVQKILPEVIGPRNEIEVEIFNIWRQMLGGAEFGVENNFFQIGGDSLSFVSMLNLVSHKMAVNLPNKPDFATIQAISEYIQSAPKI